MPRCAAANAPTPRFVFSRHLKYVSDTDCELVVVRLQRAAHRDAVGSGATTALMQDKFPYAGSRRDPRGNHRDHARPGAPADVMGRAFAKLAVTHRRDG